MDGESFRQIALAFDGVSEQPHFEKTSFRIGKKIFATYEEKANKACLKLSEVDQDVFSSFDRMAIYPVPNKWGKQGWTFVELNKVNPELIKDAMIAAFLEVSKKKR